MAKQIQGGCFILFYFLPEKYVHNCLFGISDMDQQLPTLPANVSVGRYLAISLSCEVGCYAVLAPDTVFTQN